jgi:hypothetical protein
MAIDHAAGRFTVDIVAAAQANDRLRGVPSTGAFAQDPCAVYAPARHAPGTNDLAWADADADETDRFVAPTEPRA